MTMKLKALLTFTTVGVLLEEGKHYDPSVTAKWPEGALTRRLNNKDVAFVNVDDAPETETVAQPEKGAPVDLSALTKRQLVQYAATQFGVTLDAGLNKDSLLEAVTALGGKSTPSAPAAPAAPVTPFDDAVVVEPDAQ